MRLREFLEHYGLAGSAFAARVRERQGARLSKQHVSMLASEARGTTAGAGLAAAIVRESEAVAAERGGGEAISVDELPLADGTRALIDVVREHARCCGGCRSGALQDAAA